MEKSLRFYGKKSCISCQKTEKWLQANHIDFELLAIEQNPPSVDLLEKALDENNLKPSLNTRSTSYKAKGLSEQIPAKKTLISWMLEDPNLIKRPFLVAPNGTILQGFDEKTLKAFLERANLL